MALPCPMKPFNAWKPLAKPAELPRVFLKTEMPILSGRILPVNQSCSNFQTQIRSAAGGDLITIPVAGAPRHVGGRTGGAVAATPRRAGTGRKAVKAPTLSPRLDPA